MNSTFDQFWDASDPRNYLAEFRIVTFIRLRWNTWDLMWGLMG